MFYYLLLGVSEEERKEFHLKQPEDYFYLNQVNVGTLCVTSVMKMLCPSLRCCSDKGHQSRESLFPLVSCDDSLSRN